MSDTLTPANIILMTLFLLDEPELDQLFSAAGVPIERMLESDALISIADVIALTDSARTNTGDPALGLHLGQEIGVELLDTVGMLISTAPTVREAIGQFLRYSPLLTTLGRAELVENGDEARVILHLHPDTKPIALYCCEIAGAAFWNMMRRLMKDGGDMRLRRASFQPPAPPWQEEYARVLGEETRFVFSAPENSFTFDRALLDRPMARHSPGLYQRLQQEAARRLASQPHSETASTSVRRLIREQMGQRLIDLPSIAEQMGLSPRTLQRRLREEGLTFQSLHDGCRQERARDYLLAVEGDIDSLSALLGYSEPANFYRAFKSWFGVSPNEYRRQRHQAGPAE